MLFVFGLTAMQGILKSNHWRNNSEHIIRTALSTRRPEHINNSWIPAYVDGRETDGRSDDELRGAFLTNTGARR